MPCSPPRATARDRPAAARDIARLRGHIEVNLGSATEAHRIFVEAARAVHETDPARALEMAVAAAVMRTYGADSGSQAGRRRHRRRASPTDDPPRTRLPQAAARRHDPGRPRATGRQPSTRWTSRCASGDDVDDLDVLWNLGNAALQLGDDDAQQHFYALALSRAREAGAVMAVVYALQRLCFGHFVAGDWAAVRSSAEEARRARPQPRPARP